MMRLRQHIVTYTHGSAHSLSIADDIDTSNMSKKHNKKKKKNNHKKKNILEVDHHKILAFDSDTSIFDHILNKTRYGIYYFRITLYNETKGARIMEEMQKATKDHENHWQQRIIRMRREHR
eukprot:513950_1